MSMASEQSIFDLAFDILNLPFQLPLLWEKVG